VKLKALYSFILLLFICASHAQPGQLHNRRWFFGFNSDVGLDFTGAALTPTVTNVHAQPFAIGGCAVANHPITGNLLFYTDGITVWDRQHAPMPNGLGLTANPAAAEKAAICYNPANCDQYYVFHQNSSSQDGYGVLHYSIIDMTTAGNGNAANPRGDVVVGQKNVPVMNNAMEGLCIVESDVPRTFYLIAAEAPGNSLRVFRINPAGVNPVATVALPSAIDVRSIAHSPVSNALIIAGARENDAAYFASFNKTTGAITGIFPIPGTPLGPSPLPFDGIFSAEFSPDGTKAYLSKMRNPITASGGRIFQFDLNNPGNPIIMIYDNGGTDMDVVQGLRLGPDGRIYFVVRQPGGLEFQFLGTINAPNQPGGASNPVGNSFDLGADPGPYASLPTFLHPNFKPEASNYTYSLDCDGLGGPFAILPFANTSDQNFTGYTGTSLISKPGNVDVQINNFGQEVVINVNSPMGRTDTIQFQICDNHCFSLCDTFYVRLIASGLVPGANFNFSLGESILICPGDSILLENTDPSVDVVWNGNTTDDAIWVTTQGWVYVDWETDCGNYSDSVEVAFVNMPSDGLLRDTILCANAGELILEVPEFNGLATFQWNNGSDSSSAIVFNGGQYNVVVNICDRNYFYSNTVTYLENENLAWVPSAFTPNNDGINEEFFPRGSLTGQRDFLFEIFDRWGQPIFSTDKPQIKWNATHSDNLTPVQKGSYVYKLSFIHPCTRNEFSQTGRFTLIR